MRFEKLLSCLVLVSEKIYAKSYLDPVPKAVANVCPICERYENGKRRQQKKKISEIVPKPCTNNPSITVKKYQPSCCSVCCSETISTVLAVTKKNTPRGVSLSIGMVQKTFEKNRRFSPTAKMEIYQMTQLVMIIID